jgi:hypothetical protein
MKTELMFSIPTVPEHLIVHIVVFGGRHFLRMRDVFLRRFNRIQNRLKSCGTDHHRSQMVNLTFQSALENAQCCKAGCFESRHLFLSLVLKF